MFINWSFDELYKITGGSNKTHCHEPLRINGLSIDTRNIKKGNLFCALKGENHDGHDFLLQAYRNGASSFLLSDIKKNMPNLPTIKVKNVLKALEKIAKKTRKTVDARFIGITGSVGKTGTKEMIKSALGNVGKVFANKGNFNNHIGVPLSLSNLPHDSDYCILEMGMNKRGEIKELSRLVSPEVGIITAIENSHLKKLKTLENVLEAKSEIIENIKKDGCFIYNADTNYSSRLRNKAEKLRIKTIISYGKSQNCNIQFLKKLKVNNKFLIKAKYFNKIISWEMPDLSDHWYVNSLSILGLAKYYNLKIEALLSSFENFKLPSGRGNIISIEKWAKKFFLVDDSYNSNPSSLTKALERFNEIHCKGNKIAILGDMKELGQDSLSFHLSMKENIEKTNIKIIFTIGKFMKKLNQSLSGNVEKKHFNKISDLEKELKNKIKSDDIILVKGSNSVGLKSLIKNIAGANNDL